MDPFWILSIYNHSFSEEIWNPIECASSDTVVVDFTM